MIRESGFDITVKPRACLFIFCDRLINMCRLQAKARNIFPDPVTRNRPFVLLFVFNLGIFSLNRLLS